MRGAWLRLFDVAGQSLADGTFAVRGAHPGTWFLVALPPEGANFLAAYGGAGGASTSDSALAVAIDVLGDVSDLALVMDDGLAA